MKKTRLLLLAGVVSAALLLASRKVTSRAMIAAVDWPLLLLFACLFAVTGALRDTGIPYQFIASLRSHGLMPDNLALLTPLTLLMSNTIGNVPSVILILQTWSDAPPDVVERLVEPALRVCYVSNTLATSPPIEVTVHPHHPPAAKPK